MENKFEISSPKSKWKEGRKEGDEVEDPEMRLNMKRCQINKKERTKRENFKLDLISSSNVSNQFWSIGFIVLT